MRIGDAVGKKYDVTLKATPLTNSGIEPTHPLEEHDAGNFKLHFFGSTGARTQAHLVQWIV